MTDDLSSRLLRERIVVVGGEIDDALANAVVAQILFLQGEDPARDIALYVNSRGGSTSAGLAIYDTMQLVEPAVGTVCTGLAGGTASVLLAGGAPGKRSALPHARIVLHQPLTSAVEGRPSDLALLAREVRRQRDVLVDLYVRHCGRPRERVEQAVERAVSMTAEQAVEWGVIDGIVESPSRRKD